MCGYIVERALNVVSGRGTSISGPFELLRCSISKLLTLSDVSLEPKIVSRN